MLQVGQTATKGGQWNTPATYLRGTIITPNQQTTRVLTQTRSTLRGRQATTMAVYYTL